MEPCSLRTEFQRDRDRILHCKAFRRLKHKTQVFLAPEGDHYRTRLTHTLEVSQIARTIARALRLNEDLTEAISLGHDLGHTPFGHAGERSIRECAGTFDHNCQSLRVVDVLEGDGGLNLTWEVRDGILNHKRDMLPYTLEGRVVNISDRIAYLSHDIDDALRAGVMQPSDIPCELVEAFGETHGDRINTMVLDVVQNSGEDIQMSPAIARAMSDLRDFMFDFLYTAPSAKMEETKVSTIIGMLWQHYIQNPMALPEEYYKKIPQWGEEQMVVDYIAGMSDGFALKKFNAIFVPHNWL